MRLPLLKLTVAVPDPKRLEPYTALIADELNVKSVELSDDIAAYGKFELTVNARVAGPRLGKDVQTVIRAVKSGDWAQQADGTVVAAGITLREGEFDSKLVAAEPDSTAALPEGGGWSSWMTPLPRSWKRRAGHVISSVSSRTCANRRVWRSPIGSRWSWRFRPCIARGRNGTAN